MRHHHRSIAATLALSAMSLGGCMQMTRHSNTLVFGTNTSLGIVVGTDATSTPSIAVGYKRQEAVVMPLVANVKTIEGSGEGLLEPCLIGPASGDPHGAVPSEAQALTHPCLLVGRDGADKSLDAYSVLASFGTRYDARTTGVGGSIAQYFATGVAAQQLARSGGAAVGTGVAAAASANPANVRLRALADKVETQGLPMTELAQQDAALDLLQAAIARLDPDKLDARLAAFDAKLATTLRAACAGGTPQTCAASARGRAGGLDARMAKDIVKGTAVINGE